MKTRRLLLPLAVWLLLLLAGMVQLQHTAITHDLTQFMPAGATRQQQLAVRLIREGPASRLILISLEGGNVPELAAASRAMTRRLRESGLFSLVANGSVDWSTGTGPVFRYRYLLDSGTTGNPFDVTSLRRALQERLLEISGALPLTDSTTLATDPTAAYRSILQSWQPARQPQRQHGVWFTTDGQAALITALVRKSGFDPEAQQQTVATIHAAFSDLDNADTLRLVMSGAPVFTSNTRQEIRSSLRILSASAGLLVAGLLLLVYRSPRLLVLASLPLISALVAGGALTSLLFGNLHGITLIFGITLLGVVPDYPIHLYSHLAPERTAEQSMSRIWPTIRMGMMTTCIGYLALVRPDFTGLAQLGVFTGSGLAAAAVVTRWILPPLLGIGRTHEVAVRPLVIASYLLELPVRVYRTIAAGILLVVCAAAVLSPPRWETDLAALSPIPAEQLQTDARLRSELGAADASQLLVITGDDPESVLQRSEQAAAQLARAVASGLLSGYDLAARYLPSALTQRQRQALLPQRTALEENLARAMEGLPFKKAAFAGFLDAVAESRRLQPLTPGDIGDTPLASRVGTLLFQDDQDWVALIMPTGVRNADEFRAWWEENGTTDAEPLDLKGISAAMLADFRDSALERLLLGLLAITLVLFAGIRSPLQTLRVLLPVVLAAAASVGLLGALDQPLSLFHLIALLLTIGIGIDYSLFFNRLASHREEGRPTMSAILVCALSTVTIFGILAFSPIPVLRAIGLTVTIGVPLCILFVLTAPRPGRGVT